MEVPKNMRTYYLGVVFRGDRHLARGTPEHQDTMARHLAYNRSQVEAGTYKAVGPLTDGGDIRAVAVIDVPTLEQAQAILDGDPATQQGHFRMEAHPVFWPSLDAVKIEY